MKNEIKRRIISICLALVLIISSSIVPSGKGVWAGNANAVDDYAGGMNIACGASGDNNVFSLAYSGNQLFLTYSDGNMAISSISGITMQSDTHLEVAGDVSIGTLSFSSDGGDVASATIDSGRTLTLGSFHSNSTEGGDTFINNGTLVMDSFTLSDISSKSIEFQNNGTISAATIYLDDSDASFTSSSGAVYRVSTKFVNGDDDLVGKVVATSADTVIQSSGGSFTLSYNGMTKVLSGEVDGEAGDLVKKDIMLTINTFPTIYQGTTYNLLDRVIVSDDEYDGEIQVKYYNNGGTVEYTGGIPDTADYWDVKFIAPSTDRYNGAVASTTYHIDFIDMPANPVTMTGVKNGYFVKDSITFTPTSGWKIKSSNPDSTFSDKEVFSFDYLKYLANDYGECFNSDMYFRLKRKSDGAETDTASWTNYFPELENLILDADKPVISSDPIVDGTAKSITNGSSVTAEKVEITVSDMYLDKVVSSDKTYTVDNGGIVSDASGLVLGDDAAASNSTCVVTFEAEEGTSKECSFTAYDKAGNETTFGFTLTSPKEEEEESLGEYSPKYAKTTVNLDDQYYGVNYKPTITSESKGDVLYVYKTKGTADANFTEEAPTAIGTYTVRAIVSATDEFDESIAEDDFTISYLPAPTDAYTIDGTKGKKEYYVSEVLLKAKEGYQISKWMNGTFSDSIIYSDGMKTICLKRKSDGAMTAPINMDKTLKVDTISPKLSSFGVDQDGKTVDLSKKVYADSLSFDIYDEHLETVTLDSEKQDVKNNIATIKLDADGGQNTFSIVATDEAGNEYNLQVTLLASWMKSNIIPAGSKVKLQSGSVYKLGSGRWKISGDSTIYNGNSDFYVTASGEYTFEKID